MNKSEYKLIGSLSLFCVLLLGIICLCIVEIHNENVRRKLIDEYNASLREGKCKFTDCLTRVYNYNNQSYCNYTISLIILSISDSVINVSADNDCDIDYCAVSEWFGTNNTVKCYYSINDPFNTLSLNPILPEYWSPALIAGFSAVIIIYFLFTFCIIGIIIFRIYRRHKYFAFGTDPAIKNDG
jgi:hypothetical protein